MIMTEMNQALQGIRPFIEQQMKLWNVPGLAVAVIKDQEIIMTEGFGYRDVEAGLEVKPETLFAIGSTTKAFTAVAAGILVDEGKIDLDVPVKQYLPHFKMYDSLATERVTLRDMLCHRTGLPRHELMHYNSSFTREEVIERLQYLEPNQDFRSGWQYQNIMYMIVGYVVGQRLGTTWEQAVQDKILNPLQMNVSNFSVEYSQKQPNYALPYMDQGDMLQRIPFRNIDLMGPAGSINSNLMDMAKWVMLLLNKGVHQGQQIISESSLAEVFKPHMPTDSWITKETPMSCYSLGWSIEPYRGHQVLHHGGGIDGFTAEVAFSPDENMGIVIFANKNGSPLPLILRHNLFDRLLGLDEIDWSGRIRGTGKENETENQDETHQPEEEAKEQISANEPENLTHQLHEYIGTYEHPGYGELVIEMIENNLQVTFNSIQLTLNRVKNHAFELEYKSFQLKTPATFHSDVNDQIVRVAIKMQLEPGTKDIEFVKK
ncbi:serine hydrolase [Paenibacillus terrigena]|uniref:serine hydrolase n=1 Tax=Paenibacillus terrigena TaxID=369333 RepID=UPI000370CE23|nr:serine hydrolase [Paenibacillus terrigena]